MIRVCHWGIISIPVNTAFWGKTLVQLFSRVSVVRVYVLPLYFSGVGLVG